MDTTEVTNASYRECVTAGFCKPPTDRSAYTDPEKRNHPVVLVNWVNASAYCEFRGGRLPTEVEWEYAARGKRPASQYPWGESPSRTYANYGASSCCSGEASGADRWIETSPVGSFVANGYGLYDMAGNVWEWCSSTYEDPPISKVPSLKSESAGDSQMNVVRGGSWSYSPYYLRVSARSGVDPRKIAEDRGFRCVNTEQKRPQPKARLPR